MGSWGGEAPRHGCAAYWGLVMRLHLLEADEHFLLFLSFLLLSSKLCVFISFSFVFLSLQGIGFWSLSFSFLYFFLLYMTSRRQHLLCFTIVSPLQTHTHTHKHTHTHTHSLSLALKHIVWKFSNGLLVCAFSLPLSLPPSLRLSLSLSNSQIPCPENIVHGSSFQEDILAHVAFTTNVLSSKSAGGRERECVRPKEQLYAHTT